MHVTIHVHEVAWFKHFRNRRRLGQGLDSFDERVARVDTDSGGRVRQRDTATLNNFFLLRHAGPRREARPGVAISQRLDGVDE